MEKQISPLEITNEQLGKLGKDSVYLESSNIYCRLSYGDNYLYVLYRY
jgi:hypothetical protein